MLFAGLEKRFAIAYWLGSVILGVVGVQLGSLIAQKLP